MTTTQALTGLRVVTYSPGISLVGAGMAAELPGSFFRDFGAEVVVADANSPSTLDSGVEWDRPWDRGKDTVRVGDDGGPTSLRRMAEEADVLVLAGSEALIEHEGLNYPVLKEANPRLVVVRIRPSRDRNGLIPDVELLVHARTGPLTQFRGHTAGPTFCTLPIAGIGAGLAAAAGALARLYERETTGIGGWVETSLYDGMLAMLGLVIGRVQHPSTSTERLWSAVGSGPTMTYRCGDGKFLQLWFGTPRGYDDFLSCMGDRPSDGGYMHQLQTGRVRTRSQEWEAQFATRDQAWWMERFAGKSFSCEPVLRPGEVLRDPHLRAVGLRVDYDDPVFGSSSAAGPVGEISSIAPSWASTSASGSPADRACGRPAERPGTSPAERLSLSPLSGVRVLDLSAYLAGPVASLVLAELGADVIKVEPVSGDAHRGVEPMFAAGQRGKRALALDLKSPAVEPVLRRLFEWSDVVHHNSQRGVGGAAPVRRGHRPDPQPNCHLQPRQRVRTSRPSCSHPGQRPPDAGPDRA